MHHQISKNLSNNLNEGLFDTGKIFEHDGHNSSDVVSENDFNREDGTIPIISRAEYIRQAREACIRQMDSLKLDSKYKDVSFNSPSFSQQESPIVRKKRDNFNLINQGYAKSDRVISFKHLIIRTVCAVVIFLSVLFIDQLKVGFGGFSHEIVKEYVISNDHFKKLEETVVSWLE